jgi:hypothetical protein
MVAKLHALGEFPDIGLAALRQSAQCQQEQILLRLKTCAAGRLLAPIQINPDPVSKFRKGAELSGGHGTGRHNIIVSLSDINVRGISAEDPKQ